MNLMGTQTSQADSIIQMMKKREKMNNSALGTTSTHKQPPPLMASIADQPPISSATQ